MGMMKEEGKPQRTLMGSRTTGQGKKKEIHCRRVDRKGEKENAHHQPSVLLCHSLPEKEESPGEGVGEAIGGE